MKSRTSTASRSDLSCWHIVKTGQLRSLFQASWHERPRQRNPCGARKAAAARLRQRRCAWHICPQPEDGARPQDTGCRAPVRVRDLETAARPCSAACGKRRRRGRTEPYRETKGGHPQVGLSRATPSARRRPNLRARTGRTSAYLSGLEGVWLFRLLRSNKRRWA